MSWTRPRRGAGGAAAIRICLFAHRVAEPQPTGIGRYLREFVRALAAVVEDSDSILLASTPEPAHPAWVPERIESHVVPWPRRLVQAAWCLGLGPRVERSIGRVDVVHLPHPFPPTPATASQVVTIHDTFPFEHPDWYPRSERWTYRRSVALAARRAHRLVVPSAYVGGRVAAMFDIDPDRIHVVPEGVSGTFLAPASGAEIEAVCARFGIAPRRFAICVGTISTRKNQLTLVRAAAKLSEGNFALVLVGSSGYGADAVEAELARHDGGTRVIRAGYLQERDIAVLVRAAATVVHPALAEGFGLVPLEAMAAGTPVIASRSSSIPEVVGDAGVLVDEPAEPSAWASALTSLINDDDHRRSLAARGERQAAKFSWQRAAGRMLEVYRDAVGLP